MAQSGYRGFVRKQPIPIVFADMLPDVVYMERQL